MFSGSSVLTKFCLNKTFPQNIVLVANKILEKEPTCFKNPLNPSLIDLILTNRHLEEEIRYPIE